MINFLFSVYIWVVLMTWILCAIKRNNLKEVFCAIYQENVSSYILKVIVFWSFIPFCNVIILLALLIVAFMSPDDDVIQKIANAIKKD